MASRRVKEHDGSGVVVHDFSGHPFQAQLARSLHGRGFRVTHLFCASFQTPHGDVGDDEGGADGAMVSSGISLRSPFDKYSFLKRLAQEVEYGWRLAREVRRRRPAVLISANSPLVSAVVLQIAMRVSRIPVVFWQQDVYSLAMQQHLQRRLGAVGSAIGWMLVKSEQVLVRTSAAVVVISEDFVETSRRWGVPPERITVVENWAPLEELPLGERPNPWSLRHEVDDGTTVLLYAGTLGLKHQPSMLLAIAREMSSRSDVRMIVASEGLGAGWLADNVRPEDRLELLGFQDYADLPHMLATADVLLVLLEPDAGTFSVPSKVLTYHCAGRAILGSMPSENLASRTIREAGSGVVVEPADEHGFVQAAVALVDDPDRRRTMGIAARAYAERTFDIERITDDFVAVLRSAGVDAVSGEPADGRPSTGALPN